MSGWTRGHYCPCCHDWIFADDTGRMCSCMIAVCFCGCHNAGLDQCPSCTCWHKAHPEPQTPPIEVEYKTAAEQGEDVRSTPVDDPSAAYAQNFDDLLEGIRAQGDGRKNL